MGMESGVDEGIQMECHTPSFYAQTLCARYFALHAVTKILRENSLSVLFVFIQHCIGKIGRYQKSGYQNSIRRVLLELNKPDRRYSE